MNEKFSVTGKPVKCKKTQNETLKGNELFGGKTILEQIIYYLDSLVKHKVAGVQLEVYYLCFETHHVLFLHSIFPEKNIVDRDGTTIQAAMNKKYPLLMHRK